MGVNPLDFESSASTSFTTPAQQQDDIRCLFTAPAFLLSSLNWQTRSKPDEIGGKQALI
jgi:hypothetical protein